MAERHINKDCFTSCNLLPIVSMQYLRWLPFLKKATIGADFLTKEVMIDDKLVTMQAHLWLSTCKDDGCVFLF